MTNYIERYWRDATPEDAIKEPPMVARFRSEGDAEWRIVAALTGVDRDGDCTINRWFNDKGSGGFSVCQVYDAPDPGEGWRLIDTETEKGEVGDEFLTQAGVWLPECRQNGFEYGVPYRRRIAPAVSYIPFTWEDREQLRGKKVLAKEPRRQVEFTCDEFQLNDDGSFFVGGFYSVWLCKNAVFVDTGKPVGKEIAQ